MSSRWLVLEPAANRLFEQWNCLNEYLLLYIPTRKEQRTLNTVIYKRILQYLNEETMKCQLLFILSSAKLFTQFTWFFQREDPLIHLIHNKIKCFFFTNGQLLKPKLVSILLWKHLISGHRYPLWRDGQFYIHALPRIWT